MGDQRWLSPNHMPSKSLSRNKSQHLASTTYALVIRLLYLIYYGKKFHQTYQRARWGCCHIAYIQFFPIYSRGWGVELKGMIWKSAAQHRHMEHFGLLGLTCRMYLLLYLQNENRFAVTPQCPARCQNRRARDAFRYSSGHMKINASLFKPMHFVADNNLHQG